MMTRALRRARLAPLAAFVVLIATMPVTISSLVHDEMDDAICNPAVVVHDPEAHEVGAPDAAFPDPQHCLFCHAFQSLRAVSTGMRFAALCVDARLVTCPASEPLAVSFVSNRPARAPPLLG